MRHRFSNSRGVVGLLTVIMIGALMLSGGIAVAFIGQSQVILAGDVDNEHVARMLAASCVEETVYRLRRNPTYVGGTVPLGSDSCTATVTGSGNARTLTATAVYGAHTKIIVVGLTRKANVAGNASGWSVATWTESGPP